MVVQHEIRTSFATWRSKIQNDNPQINRSVRVTAGNKRSLPRGAPSVQ
jgi:hypothetical protein